MWWALKVSHCKYQRGIGCGVKVEIRLKVRGCEKFTPAELWGGSLEKFKKKMKFFGD